MSTIPAGGTGRMDGDYDPTSSILAHKHQSRLKDLKDKVKQSSAYFQKNYQTYNDFMRFIFDTTMTSEDITKLYALHKPSIEFNVLEAMVNRLRGEFAKQEPSIKIHAADGVPAYKFTDQYLQMMDVIESYIRHLITDSTNDGLQYKIYTDLLGGGFSVVEIFTDYLNEMSFDQKIEVKRVFDPTLTGFDPLARQSHKGDGQYCFQIYPKTKDEFIREFGAEPTKEMRFTRIEGFNWSYKTQNVEIILICELFEKRYKREKIVKISTGHTVTKKHYKELLVEWEKRGFVEQAPIIIEERMTEIESIVRYQFCDTSVLSYDETDYKFLPLIFVDGNSVEIRDTDSNASVQKTRPYPYQARGIQRLKNFAGQTVASEIENMVQHKFKVSVEAVPEDFQQAYRNIQQADVLMYNAFYKGNPDIPLAPPQEIQRTPTPPLVESTFLGSDRVTQAILGSYDGVLGINDKDISGIAIMQGAIQSSAASTPYLMGYIQGLNRICHVLLDLIPKYIVTPRTLPIIDSNGKRGFRFVNHPEQQQSIEINYNPNDLQIKVEAGVNTAIQKQVALDQIIKMMQASPLFAQFINTQGLETLLDNMDIRGIEGIKHKALQFMEQMRQQQEAQANQPSPEIESLKLQAEAMKTEADAAQGRVQVAAMEVAMKKEQNDQKMALEAAKLAIEKQKVDAQVMDIMADIQLKGFNATLEQERVDSENARTAIETAMELTKMQGERQNVHREED